MKREDVSARIIVDAQVFMNETTLCVNEWVLHSIENKLIEWNEKFAFLTSFACANSSFFIELDHARVSNDKSQSYRHDMKIKRKSVSQILLSFLS